MIMKVERIRIIDSLRGFSLLGIFLVNAKITKYKIFNEINGIDSGTIFMGFFLGIALGYDGQVA